MRVLSSHKGPDGSGSAADLLTMCTLQNTDTAHFHNELRSLSRAALISKCCSHVKRRMAQDMLFWALNKDTNTSELSTYHVYLNTLLL